MGIISRFGNYYIDYRYQGRRIRERIGPQKRMAEQALAVRKSEIAQGRYQLKKHGSVRFDAFAKVYLDYATTNKRSWRTDKDLLKNLTPFFGNRLLSDISPFFIESYKKMRAERVKPATVNREISLLKHIYFMAIKWGKATTNPMRDVRLFREDNIPERILNKEEIARLLSACSDHCRPIVLTGIHTGMRLGEVLSLKWEQVDLQERMITILHSKNGKVRKIPIDDTLLETLKAQKVKTKSENVFVYFKTGQPLHKIESAWRIALGKAGIPHLRYHDLRHTFASHLVAAGVDLVTVKELLGHSNITMTSRYAHSAPESKRRAVAILNERLNSGSGHDSGTQDVLREKSGAL